METPKFTPDQAAALKMLRPVAQKAVRIVADFTEVLTKHFAGEVAIDPPMLALAALLIEREYGLPLMMKQRPPSMTEDDVTRFYDYLKVLGEAIGKMSDQAEAFLNSLEEEPKNRPN